MIDPNVDKPEEEAKEVKHTVQLTLHVEGEDYQTVLNRAKARANSFFGEAEYRMRINTQERANTSHGYVITTYEADVECWLRNGDEW